MALTVGLTDEVGHRICKILEATIQQMHTQIAALSKQPNPLQHRVRVRLCVRDSMSSRIAQRIASKFPVGLNETRVADNKPEGEIGFERGQNWAADVIVIEPEAGNDKGAIGLPQRCLQSAHHVEIWRVERLLVFARTGIDENWLADRVVAGTDDICAYPPPVC